MAEPGAITDVSARAGLPVVLDDGAQYLYGAGLGAMLTATGTYYYLADGLGSTMAMIDSTGAVQKSYTYDVYGKPTATGALPNEFDFAGQQTDGTTGLQFLRARYYDVETGTFTSREPLETSPGWTGNAFGYAACGPVTMVDPTGLRPDDGSGGSSSARQRACNDIANSLWQRARQMREDREVIQGRGTGRPVSDADKKGRQKRWRNNQRSVQALMGRWRRLECAKHVGNGSLPNDIDELEHGEYPKFDSSRWHWPDIDLPDLPEVPDVWWDGDPVDPWKILPPIGPQPWPRTY